MAATDVRYILPTLRKGVFLSVASCAFAAAALGDMVPPGPPRPGVALPMTLSLVGLIGVVVIATRQNVRKTRGEHDVAPVDKRRYRLAMIMSSASFLIPFASVG